MKYMGSKNRIAKDIIPIITKYQYYVRYYIEPFVGGANIIDKIPCNLKRIGYDLNPYLIALLKALQDDNWVYPKEYNNEYYKYVKDHKNEFDPAVVGFIGTNSYGGKFFSGFRRDSIGKRNYYKEYCRNLDKQRKYLKNIEFKCMDYLKISLPNEPCIIYCDPPYNHTTKYQYNKIDYHEFWEWCRGISIHNYVYISSFEAPSDFKCIWEKERNISLTKDTGSKKETEKLFIKNT